MVWRFWPMLPPFLQHSRTSLK